MSNEIIPKAENQIYYPELDGLRFFAFFLVFIHHHALFASISSVKFLHDFGWIGVDLFFVLSAFLFTKLLTIEYERFSTINFKKFYLRRIFRIWPVYFFIIAISLIYYFQFLHKPFLKTAGLRIFGLFFFSDNIFSATLVYVNFPFISHLWTICYEEQFYIVIPITILYLVRASKKVKVLFTLSIISILLLVRIALIVKTMPHPAIWVLPVTHFESIVLGIIVGFGGLNFLVKKVPSIALLTFSIGFFYILTQLPAIDTVSMWMNLSYLMVGLSTTFILLATLKSNILKGFLSNKALVYLGKRSYGLYIYHLLAIFVAGKISNYLHSNSLYLSFILSLIVTIVLSILSYKFIETPFLKLKKKFEMVKSRPI